MTVRCLCSTEGVSVVCIGRQEEKKETKKRKEEKKDEETVASDESVFGNWKKKGETGRKGRKDRRMKRQYQVIKVYLGAGRKRRETEKRKKG